MDMNGELSNKTTPGATGKTSAAREAARDRLMRHLERLLPDPGQADAFRESMGSPPPVSLRFNPLLPQTARLRQALRPRITPVPWCPEGAVLPGDTPRLGHTLEHLLGLFYIQAQAPMLAVAALLPEPGQRVLDLCAAPGGKTTHIAACMDNRGLLVANEPQRRRLPALVGHLERCGVAPAVVLQHPGQELARHFHNVFDRVLVDAPCSGDGVLRKNAAMLNYWSPADARNLAQTQIGLLRAAFHMLRPGGELVYSTCSLSTEENEDVLLGLLRRYADQVQFLPVPHVDLPPLPPPLAGDYPSELARCARIWPHLHDTEGAFVARLRKLSPTRWPRQEGDAAGWLDAASDTPAGAASLTAAGSPAAEGRVTITGCTARGARTTAAGPPAHASVREAAVAGAFRDLESQWGSIGPLPPGCTVTLTGRHLCLQPSAGFAFARHCPFYVRSGMHIARMHKGHAYLSQQSVALWGEQLQGPRLQLTWPQLRQFCRDAVLLPQPHLACRGEVLLTCGPWTVCRGIVAADGTLHSMLPRDSRRADLQRLLAFPD